MARADYRCANPDCPLTRVIEHTYSMTVGAIASAPPCPTCGVLMTVIPFCRFDLKTDGQGDKGGFQKFTVHRQVPTADGPVHVEETIDSLHTLRRIERESEQAHRNGEGEKLLFRAYSNESTNKDVGLFGPFVPEDAKLKKSGRVRVKAVTPADGGEPTVETGPGMAGVSSSALVGGD